MARESRGRLEAAAIDSARVADCPKIRTDGPHKPWQPSFGDEHCCRRVACLWRLLGGDRENQNQVAVKPHATTPGRSFRPSIH